MNWISLLAALFLAGFIYFLRRAWRDRMEGHPRSTALLPASIFGVLLVGLLGAIWVIAGSDRLFRSAVPLEQRLVSYNDSIRRKAQQELLGSSIEDKTEMTARLMAGLRRDDPFVRKWSAISLALIGPAARDAIPALLQSVSDKESEVAQASRVALSEIGVPDPRQLPALLQALQDPREPVRCEAAASLSRMGPAADSAVPLLLGYIQRSTATPACFQDSLASLISGQPEKAESLAELITSGHRDVRWKAADVLAKVHPPPPAALSGLLQQLAVETDPDIRTLLARALILPQVPADGRAPVYSMAARRSGDVGVRRTALRTVLSLTPPVADLELILSDALRDPDVDVRLLAARWLRTTGAENRRWVPHLTHLLRDSDAGVRRAALDALFVSPIRPSAALPLIARAQRDPDPAVRCRAVKTLVEWAATDRISLPLLVADLGLEDDQAACAVAALGSAGHFHAGVVREMIRVLNTGQRQERIRASAVLLQLGARGRDAISALEKAQNDRIPGAGSALRVIRSYVSEPKPVRRRRR